MKYGKRDNEIAERIRGVVGIALDISVASPEFLRTPEWKAMRRQVVKHYGRRCMCCGKTPENPKNTNVDHIKPRKFFPELALTFDNLQVLCGRCNKEKSNRTADFRGRKHKVEKARIRNFEHVDRESINVLRSLSRNW